MTWCIWREMGWCGGIEVQRVVEDMGNKIGNEIQNRF